MPREKFQIFLPVRTASIVHRLCGRYGWTASDVVHRLALFYANLQTHVADLDVVEIDGVPEDRTIVVMFDRETGTVMEADLAPVAFELIEKVKEGLTPEEGFGEPDEMEVFES